MPNQETNMSDRDISQVLPGPCCGRFVSEPNELERTLAELGIERTDEHPEFTMEPEEDFEVEGAEFDGNILLLGAVHGMGHHQELPGGTPRHFPPFLGATQRWSERTRHQVRRIRQKAPGIVCATYRNHARTGEPWVIDVMVSTLHQMANDREKPLATRSSGGS